jgi:hypothetical protein
MTGTLSIESNGCNKANHYRQVGIFVVAGVGQLPRIIHLTTSGRTFRGPTRRDSKRLVQPWKSAAATHRMSGRRCAYPKQVWPAATQSERSCQTGGRANQGPAKLPCRTIRVITSRCCAPRARIPISWVAARLSKTSVNPDAERISATSKNSQQRVKA